MFESLTRSRPRKGMAQPLLAFGLHVGVIALAVRGTAASPVTIVRPKDPPPVIYIPAPGRTPAQVGTSSGGEAWVPTVPIVLGRPAIPGALPVAIVPGPGLPDPRRLIATSGEVYRPGGSAFGEDSSLYQETDLSDPPTMVQFPRPLYPPALRNAGIEGAVTVTYVVNRDGHVEPGSVSVVSSDRPEMAESVRLSLQTALFRPGRVRGQTVRVLVRQTVRFAATRE